MENDIPFTSEVVRLRKRNKKYFEAGFQNIQKNTEELFKLEILDLLTKILEELDSRFERLKSVSDLFSFIDPKTLLCTDSNS
jgi:hypothetical protein